MLSLWVLGLIFISFAYNPVLTNKSTVQFVIVTARNGERTPDPSTELYANDIYRRFNFDPPGYGQLTKNGEVRSLNLGKFLLNEYKGLLGSTYIPESIEARSMEMRRTKDSLKFILNGLYPGTAVPTKFDATIKDTLLCPQLCSEYVEEYLKARQTPEAKKELANLDGFTKNLRKWAGPSTNYMFDMYFIYACLEAESYMNLTMPDWTKKVYPNGDLLKAVVLEFNLMNYNTKLIKLNAGRLIKKFKEDMESVKNGKMDKKRKLMLYVAYDLNIVAVLKALGVFYAHAPKFTSAVFVELHLIAKAYFVKINYYLGDPGKIKTLTIANCDELCPLDKFFNVIKNVIPSDLDLECDRGNGGSSAGAAVGLTLEKFRQMFSE